MAQSNQNDGTTSVNVLPHSKTGSEHTDEFLAFSLAQNIYTSLLLLYTRKRSDGRSLHSFINEQTMFKLKFLTLMSYLVQMSGILYFLANWNASFDRMAEDTQYIHDCEIPTDDYRRYHLDIEFDRMNDTVIGNQQCVFSKIKAVYEQSYEAQNVAAKVIAVFMLVSFLTADILAVPRLVMMSRITQGKIQFLWMLLALSQILLVVALVIRVPILIYNEDDPVNILTVGLSFIILAEIDDRVYSTVGDTMMRDLKFHDYGDDLFYFKFKKEAISTIYHYISVESHDCVVLGGALLGALGVTILWAMLPYYGFAINVGITCAIAIICGLIPGIVLPAFPRLMASCKAT